MQEFEVGVGVGVKAKFFFNPIPHSCILYNITLLKHHYIKKLISWGKIKNP